MENFLNFELLAYAIRTKNFKSMRYYSQVTEPDDKKLLQTICDIVCHEEVETHLIQVFEIYCECRDLLCEDFNENIDLTKVNYWARRIRQDRTGNFELF